MPTDDELSELLARALDDGPPAPPPERVAALRARAESARHSVSSAPAPVRRGRALTPWLAAAAALVALVAGVTALRTLDGGGDGTAGAVEYDGPMTGPEGEQLAAELKVVATGIGRVIDLDTEVLPILPTGDYYQVWFVGRGDSPETPNRISAGTFHPDPGGRSAVQFAAAVNPELYPVVEVTAEPGDGNPLPTGPVVLRARI